MIFDLVFLAAGAGALLAAALPRVLSGRAFSMPLVFLGAGLLLFALPLGLPRPDPLAYQTWVEHTTEAVVIISLMGAGLALNRPVGWRAWRSTWRLLAIAMPLTVAGIAGVAYGVLGWPLAAALLIGAVLAPTDPVLASDVQVGEPTDDPEAEDEVRFALTSEAGLNDSLAFPFVYAAIALAITGGGTSWFGGWLLDEVLYKIGAGVAIGFVVGRILAALFFRAPGQRLRLAEHAEGFVAVAATFLTYGVAEVAQAYGFIAVFVAACTIRAAERDHGYHQVLHGFIEQVERLAVAWLLLLVGGALVTGSVGEFRWSSVIVAVAVVFIIRPLAAWLSLLGGRTGWRERLAISFFGIRGIGSLYYLAYALGAASFVVPERELWTVVLATVVLSVAVHGITATPIMNRLDLLRRVHAEQRLGTDDPDQSDVAQQRL
jgi:sodium/hydrogen antiporter